MAKFTVNKEVFWNTGTKNMTGRIKQIMGDYIVVKATDANYIVNKANLLTKPISKLASLCVFAGLKDKEDDTIEISFGPDGRTMTYLDRYDPKTGDILGGCDSGSDTDDIDRLWINGAKKHRKAMNPKRPPGGATKIQPTQTIQLTPNKVAPISKPQTIPTKIPMKQQIGK